MSFLLLIILLILVILDISDIALLSFSRPLISMDKVSYQTKCLSFHNLPYMAIPTLIDSNPDEYK